MAISRTREYSADAGAAKLTGNPRAWAWTLQGLDGSLRQMPMEGNLAFAPLLIINGFSGRFMANLFATHPSTENRVEQLLKFERELLSYQ
jgi:heat shock protein HtpX